MSCILICNPIAHFQSTILPHIALGTTSLPIEGMRPQMREWQQFGPNNTKCCILAQVHKMAQISFSLIPGQRLLKEIN